MVGYQFWFDPGNLFSGSNSVHFYEFFDASLNTLLLERGFHFSLQKLFSHCTLYSQSSIEMFLTQLKNEACKNNLFLPNSPNFESKCMKFPISVKDFLFTIGNVHCVTRMQYILQTYTQIWFCNKTWWKYDV